MYELLKLIHIFRSAITGVQPFHLLVVVSLFFTIVFLKKLMIDNISTLNKTKITQGLDMTNNITKTNALPISFTDLLWNVSTSIAGSAKEGKELSINQVQKLGEPQSQILLKYSQTLINVFQNI